MERNVKITRTFLGREDHGIPSFTLQTESHPFTQGFGGWDLRFYGIATLMKIVDTVGAPCWEGLAGLYCRVRSDENQRLVAIGHITEDRWYDIEAEGRLVA